MDWQKTDFLDVVGIEIEQSEPRLRLGYAHFGRGVYGKAMVGGQTGVVAIPDPPDADGACSAVVTADGCNAHVWHTYDARYADRIGQLPAGSRGFVTRGEARLLLNPEREQVSTYTLHEGNVMMVDVDGASGSLTLIVGDKVIQIAQSTDSIKLMCGNSTWVELTKNGLNVSAPAINIVGACDLGTDGLTPGTPLAKYPELAAWAAQVNTALAEIATVLNASAGPVNSAPGTVTPVVLSPAPTTNVAAT